MQLALNDLLQLKWSNKVLDEWIENLLKNRADLSRKKLEKTKGLMNKALLDCLVEEYEKLEEKLNLPDQIRSKHLFYPKRPKLIK